jgi:hypothetical protein
VGSSSRIIIALVLFSLGACTATHTRNKAEGRRVLVEPGMTGHDVQGRIGNPNKVFPVQPVPGVTEQTVMVWEYTMKPPAGWEDAAEFVVASGALVVVAVASKGNNLNGVGGFGSSNRGTCTFWIGFGPDGKVRGVSPLEVAR